MMDCDETTRVWSETKVAYSLLAIGKHDLDPRIIPRGCQTCPQANQPAIFGLFGPFTHKIDVQKINCRCSGETKSGFLLVFIGPKYFESILAWLASSWLSWLVDGWLVGVCVRERERERENVCVRVCVCMYACRLSNRCISRRLEDN